MRNHNTGHYVELTNKQLIEYSVRQLNKLVAGFPRDTVHKLKLRRRTLKNRGYAQNCRHKRLDQKNKLEKQNEELRRENTDLRERLSLCIRQLNLLRQQQVDQTGLEVAAAAVAAGEAGPHLRQREQVAFQP